MARTEDIIRIGQVSSINPINSTVRVAFDDMQDDGTPLVSYDLQMLYHRTVDCKNFTMPEVGEHVLCAFLPNGYQEGFVLGSYNTALNGQNSNLFYYREPENLIGKRHLYRTHYKDGTIIEYDLNTNTARIYSEYYINLECKADYDDANYTLKIEVDAKEATVALSMSDREDDTITLDMEGQTGKVSLWTKDDINITTEADKNVTVEGNVTINVKGDASVNVAGDTRIETGGDMELIAGGDMTLKAARIDLNP